MNMTTSSTSPKKVYFIMVQGDHGDDLASITFFTKLEPALEKLRDFEENDPLRNYYLDEGVLYEPS